MEDNDLKTELRQRTLGYILAVIISIQLSRWFGEQK
jgi:hypothetical protein